METIREILSSAEKKAEEKMNLLKSKTIDIPSWFGVRGKGLVYEYEPSKHPVMDKGIYPDIVHDKDITHVTRVTCNLQQLAVKRMTELMCGVPVKRVYSPENDRQKEIADYMEKIFMRSRIDTVNNERLSMLYAGCEVMTLWYAVESQNNLYGFKSSVKMRCRNFSPMQGDELYPLFDEYGDMVAMSVAYTRKVGRKTVRYMDVYTDDKHYKYSNASGSFEEVENEDITLMKIPCIYMYRPTPIWENQSDKVYEIEWSLSRNGNYLRENSRPMLCVFADEQIEYDKSPETDKAFKDIAQFPVGSSVQYVTWQQAVENLKFYVEQLRSMFFAELQLPDWNYDKMLSHAQSGESRKQMLIDPHLKARDESGRVIEFLDREVNVVKAFLKQMLGDEYANDIDALPVEIQITPFTITEEKDTVNLLMAANGGEPLISQRESIEQLGWSSDVDKTLQEIHEQKMVDTLGMAQ